MDKLIKSALGQWKLVEDLLRKSPEDGPIASAPIPASSREDNSKKLTQMFSEQNDHVANNRIKEAHNTKGKIKDFVLKSAPGSIDVGHLGKLRDTQLKTKHPDKPNSNRSEQPLGENDMNEIINHHLGNVKNLKDMHDNHGGVNTVEAVLKTIGAKADPTFYSNMKFKNPNIYLDMVDLLNPGKSDYERNYNEEGTKVDPRHRGIFNKPYFNKTEVDPKLHEKVKSTWDAMLGDHNEHLEKAHENAVIDRALDRFKRHHKLN